MRNLLVLFSSFILACAAPPPVSSARTADGTNPSLNTHPEAKALVVSDVDAWLDGLMPGMMHSGDVPGAIVTVVKDGQILTVRGYGYSDVARRAPVDPQRTLFAIGSISKVFTATAVMQLVEQGKLDLDADVNRYLDFSLPARAGGPVTMRQLLNHTAGFEEKLKYVVSQGPMMPLDRYIKESVPVRIFPAGKVPAYSNYGSALAGYIVQRVSGEKYDDYMDRHILGPLGMHNSTFRRPVPAALVPRLAKGYTSGSDQPGYIENFGPAPAGSLYTSGPEAAQFMIAHLAEGRIADRQIFSAATARQMHAIQPKFYPSLPGMSLGFYEQSRNGHRVLAHNGGTQYFMSDMHLFLDDGVGLFVSLSSSGKDGQAAHAIHQSLFHGFADRYFPGPAPAKTTGVDLQTARKHAAMMVGPWENSRRADSSAFSILYRLVSTMNITANEDGTINVPLPTGVMRAKEVAPFVWRDTKGDETLEVTLKDGRPVLLGWSIAPPAAMIPVPSWRSPSWILPAVGISLVCLFFSGLAWPVRALIRRRYGAALPYTGRAALAYRSACGFGLAAALSYVGVVGVLLAAASKWDRLDGSMDNALVTAQALAVFLLVAAVVAAFAHVIFSWRQRRGWYERAGSVLIFVSSAMLLWTAWLFHFTTLGVHY